VSRVHGARGSEPPAHVAAHPERRCRRGRCHRGAGVRRPVAGTALRVLNRRGPTHGHLGGSGRRRARHVGRGAGPRYLPRRIARPTSSRWWCRRPATAVDRRQHGSRGSHLTREPHGHSARRGTDRQAPRMPRRLARNAARGAAQAAIRQHGAGSRVSAGTGSRPTRPRSAARRLVRAHRLRARAPPAGSPDGRSPRVGGADAPGHADRTPYRERTSGGGAETDGARRQVADERRSWSPDGGTRAAEALADRRGERGGRLRAREDWRVARSLAALRRVRHGISHEVFARNPLWATSSCSTSCSLLSTWKSGPVHRTAKTWSNSQARRRSPV
jgi:hypothetical protein